MDRGSPDLWEIKRQRLVEVEQHIALGRSHIDKQIALIARLIDAGHSTDQAAIFLESLNEMQEQHEADRDRLATDLSKHEADDDQGDRSEMRPADVMGTPSSSSGSTGNNEVGDD